MEDARVLEARVNELELRFTEQQHLLQTLNEVVYDQSRTIDRLGAELGRVRERLSAEPGLLEAQADERPPHY